MGGVGCWVGCWLGDGCWVGWDGVDGKKRLRVGGRLHLNEFNNCGREKSVGG